MSQSLVGGSSSFAVEFLQNEEMKSVLCIIDSTHLDFQHQEIT